MKYTVKINNKSYDVDIQDIHARPVIAIVDGEEIQVWIEDSAGQKPALRSVKSQPSNTSSQTGETKTREKTGSASVPGSGDNQKIVRSPIPGVIVSVSVQKEAQVAVGQELCVLEAMKMKNVIRSPRAGTIAAVHIISGQTVQHHDPLVEYTE